MHVDCIEEYENPGKKKASKMNDEPVSLNQLDEAILLARCQSETLALAEEANAKEKIAKIESGQLIQIPRTSINLKRAEDTISIRNSQTGPFVEGRFSEQNEEFKIDRTSEEYASRFVKI